MSNDISQVQSPIDWQSINEYVRETSRQIREMKDRLEESRRQSEEFRRQSEEFQRQLEESRRQSEKAAAEAAAKAAAEADRRLKEWQAAMEEERAKREEERAKREEERAKREEERARREEERAKREEERARLEAAREARWEEERARAKAEREKENQELKRMSQETDRRFKRADQRMKQLDELFTGQWGKLMEALMAPAALKLFQNLGIGITHIHQDSRHHKANGHEIEVDLMLVNSNVLVAVEVKTTCRKDDIDHFLKQMEYFKELFTEFKNYTVYPAVAAIKYNNYSDIYAHRKGMFVLRTSGNGIFTLDVLPEEQRKKY